MKRMMILSLALLLAFTAPALAFNYARFAGLEGVTVDYDPENPSTYVVKAGFSDSAYWSQFGGHLVVRYLNAGKDEELPLMLPAFTTSGVKGTQMAIRTDAHRYAVTCTDLTQAGMTPIEMEATLLVAPASADMLADVAASEYVKITVWDEDSSAAFSFSPDDGAKALLQLFLEEYSEEIAPMLAENATLVKVYDRLAPAITCEDAPSMANEDVRAILNAEYTALKNGSIGDAVSRLQQALTDLGYLNDRVDGIFGKKTAKAVQDFQTAAGLTATGAADAETQIELYLRQLESAQ